MTARAHAVTASATAAVVVIVAVGLHDSRGSQLPAAHAQSGGVREDCSSQSSARFPGAFADRRNLVVGPLALVGGSYTPASTVRRFGGNKFPLLVKAGHTVTVSVPRASRRLARLGYGPLPEGRRLRLRDGHHTVTFVACPPGSSLSSAGGPVTFWSGFVLTSGPRCVPLDVTVDEEPSPRRVGLSLGRRCRTPAANGPRGATAAAQPPLRDCGSRAEGGKPPAAASRPGDVVVGPIAFAGLRGVASRRGLEHDRSGRRYLVKAGVEVLAGTHATLAIAPRARSRAALTYATRRLREVSDGDPAIRFQACRSDEPAFSYDGPVGIKTGFAGGFILSRPGCVPLEVRVSGRPTMRASVPFGVGDCDPGR